MSVRPNRRLPLLAPSLSLVGAFGLLSLTLGLGAACHPAELRAGAARPQPRVCGRMLYQRHCMSCHGPAGLGDGPGAAQLDPKPRDFSQGTFRLVSTDNGVPTDADLFDVITRGIVGSAMPPHEHLSVPERQALVKFVRGLSRSTRADVLQAQAAQSGAPMSRPEALAAASEAPGAVVQLPAPLPPTPELLAEGRRLYVSSCAACHDQDGSGRTRDDMRDDTGQLVSPRDFTAGVLKGGSEPLDIHRRIACGMPGSPMPSLDLPPRQAQALASYVASLIPPGAQQRLAQVHTDFSPQRVEGLLSADPGAAIWDEVTAHWVPLAPLQWTEQRVPGFLLQLARDETSLGLRLVWEDASAQGGGQNLSPDTALVRFSARHTPQFFCPGRTGETNEAWAWDAEQGDQRYSSPPVQITSRHQRGFYELVFLRDLATSPERVGLSAAGTSVAFEIRNGAAGGPDRSQNLTVWHRLTPSP